MEPPAEEYLGRPPEGAGALNETGKRGNEQRTQPARRRGGLSIK